MGFFQNRGLILTDESEEENARKHRQVMARHKELAKSVAGLIVGQRILGQSHGPNIKKVKWKEFEDMMRDYIAAQKEGLQADFSPQSTYARSLMYYVGGPRDGQLRDRPIRLLLENEVGMIGDTIIVLADAGPDDVGEGAYHQVTVALEKKEEGAG
jgi:hypothetical protein